MEVASVNPYTEQIMEEFETLSFEESAKMHHRSRQASIFYLARVNLVQPANLFWPESGEKTGGKR